MFFTFLMFVRPNICLSHSLSVTQSVCHTICLSHIGHLQLPKGEGNAAEGGDFASS